MRQPGSQGQSADSMLPTILNIIAQFAVLFSQGHGPSTATSNKRTFRIY